MTRFPWRARCALLACVSALFCLPAAPASAQYVEVWACLGPESVPVPFGGFHKVSDNGAALYDDDCAANENTPLAHVYLNGVFQNGDETGWRLIEPPGLEISEAAWRGTLLDAWRGHASKWAAQIVAGGVVRYSEAGPLGRDLRQVPIQASAGDVVFQVRSLVDGAVADELDFGIENLRVTLGDASSPTASDVHGSATTPGYKSGSVSLAFEAADVGAGVKASRLMVDDKLGALTPFAGNPASCASIAGRPNAYQVAVPCRTSITDSRAIDTTALGDGAHVIQLRLQDAAGNEAGVWKATLRVNNPGGELPETACADGLDNDDDGTVDAGHDAGCSGPTDADETAPPASTAPPAVIGAVRSGRLIARQAGTWDDGPGTGGVTAVRWQAARYDGAAPVDIPGATGDTLQLTDQLLGRRIRVVETRTTSQGAASAASAYSAVVTREDGTLPACADGRDNDDDNKIDHDADVGCSSRSDTTEDLTSPDEDRDDDGVLNRDDPDDDGDGTPDAVDPRPFDPNEDGRAEDGSGVADDRDGDGQVNGADPDDDNDGVPDGDDPAPLDPTIPRHTPSSPSTTIIIDRTTTNTTTTTVNGPPTNGLGGSDKAVVSIAGAQTRSLGFGRRTVMAGRLVNEHGQPIVGAALAIAQAPFVPAVGIPRGATFRSLVPAEPLVTDRDGRFRYLLPAGHSRVVRFGYKARTADRDFTATQDLTLVVTSKATLKVSRRSLRNGQIVRFRGKVLGSRIPATGLQVVLQARTARGWVAFKTVRARRNGAFKSSYRFTATTQTRTYEFRARVRPDSSWPWKPSTTRTTKVRVRP